MTVKNILSKICNDDLYIDVCEYVSRISYGILQAKEYLKLGDKKSDNLFYKSVLTRKVVLIDVYHYDGKTILRIYTKI